MEFGIMNNIIYKKIYKFTDLVAWQEGHKLVLMIYSLIKQFPIDEKFGLADQLKRAAVSVTSNIAEGFTKKSSKEKNQYYNRSVGSLTEIQNQLIIGKDIGIVSQENYLRVTKQSLIVHKLLNGLIRSTRLKEYE